MCLSRGNYSCMVCNSQCSMNLLHNLLRGSLSADLCRLQVTLSLWPLFIYLFYFEWFVYTLKLCMVKFNVLLVLNILY